jgi:hypothetical protein
MGTQSFSGNCLSEAHLLSVSCTTIGEISNMTKNPGNPVCPAEGLISF